MAIAYPYLPEGRAFKFVPDGDPFLEEAKRARSELAGDPIWPNGAVLVRDGKVIARAGNGYNRGSHLIHICPRIVHDCPSGQGYELCDLHDSPGHAEWMVVKVAQQEGIETQGADLYMYGHWWCCKPCWDAMIAAGIRDVYLLEGADQEFTREKVHAPYLIPQIKKACLLGGDVEKVFPVAFEACQEINCDLSKEMDEESEVVMVHADHEEERQCFFSAAETGKPIILLSSEGTDISQETLDHPSVVYHLIYKSDTPLKTRIKNILIQL